jgi:hypothetical protein
MYIFCFVYQYAYEYEFIRVFSIVYSWQLMFIVVFRVWLTIEVDDITGYTVFNAFDHVMVDVAVRNSHVSGSATLKTLKSLNVR